MGFRRVTRRQVLKGAGAAGALAALSGPAQLLRLPWESLTTDASADASWQWYKADLHVHSCVSSDAYSDLGIVSQNAKANGYNALFLTDHNLASSFPIAGVTANHLPLDDSVARWTSGTYGILSATANGFVTSPVNTGTKSLHLLSSSASYGETFVWARRGPNFRSGDSLLSFAVYPTQIDSGSGLYVSVTIGGDLTVSSPLGDTTRAGVISPGKSIVYVWQLGSPRIPSSTPNAQVFTFQLGPYNLNTWNTYTIDISTVLSGLTPADLPVDYNGWTILKVVAAGNGGTAEGYFDTYSVNASVPPKPADEFVYRNSQIGAYNSGTFVMFPSVEMGVNKHASRFNFGISDPSQFVSYVDGTSGILPAQQTGYPVQLNHPGDPGGVTMQEAITTLADGADLMEVRKDAYISVWDSILQQGVQVIGTGTTDNHPGTFSGSSFTTQIYAPALALDPLMQSVFEGRANVAVGNFGGILQFNLDNSTSAPYPARYPVYVPAAQSTANAHLYFARTSRSTTWTVKWLVNGTVIATDPVGGAFYDATRSFSLSTANCYVRAEVRNGTSLLALSQPIFFVQIPSLPAGMSYHIVGVTTADGRQYTKIYTKGITGSSWDSANLILSIALEDPASAVVELVATPGPYTPTQVQVDGTLVAPAASLTAFQAATGSSWFFDVPAALLHLKALHAATTASVAVRFS